jgi:hypothetical protein
MSGVLSRPDASNPRSSVIMTKEELIEAACEIIGVSVEHLSVDQVQRLTTIT